MQTVPGKAFNGELGVRNIDIYFEDEQVEAKKGWMAFSEPHCCFMLKKILTLI